MPSFEYKAVSPTGETVQGVMEAASLERLIAKLQEGGNVPLAAHEAGQGGLKLDLLRLGRRRGMNAREIGQFTQQLATLLGAGLPLDRSLQVLIELAESGRIRRTVADIRDRVREGDSLSEALEAQHGAFSRLYLNMVRAGEIGGTLDRTLERLTEYLDRSKDLKDSVVSALIYPVLLILLAAGSLILLLVYVIPQFTPIFEELGGDMPLITKVVLAVGGVLQHFWWGLIGVAVLVVLWFRKMLADEQRRFRWDGWVLATRWVGDLVAKLETARLARTLGTLLVNGVPLLSALSIARNVVSNSVLRQDVRDAAREVKTGGGLARNLASGGRFPRLALQMISVGEETGRLDGMLLKVADTYDREVRNTIDRLLSVFTPVVTLLLAVMIGTIVLSVLLAILSVNELVG
ncbi:MAG: type II secretion system protein GspF [Xanthomonadales bacterium]|uniref:type II secretion system F family protein n=1 Tax=Hydrogenophaga sp. TaxID=1904254 RepID=UPI0016B652C8|nr:type II secretion system F family protein [Hydrogenophaga sp.]NIM69167.1 type II secretion system protein GspF [Xanthomonadales bacterium]NIN31190.1 type II secretion system protein GspF [Hydrogenophaga sp.]NIN58460.1 type II secretion system protein GspF [Xanthomonadales bacterium]NIN73782.1 type II secretion system protein GspF [Xanthomonadales bacterium]NIO13759.1 type II secretion system protein GspF [Xanthomonadales bacterium]